MRREQTRRAHAVLDRVARGLPVEHHEIVGALIATGDADEELDCAPIERRWLGVGEWKSRAGPGLAPATLADPVA